MKNMLGLDVMAVKGVPLPLRLQAAILDVSLQDLINHVAQDSKVKPSIKKWFKSLDITTPNNYK